MPERCPLYFENGTPEDVLEVCLTQCGAIYDKVSLEPGEWDDYLRDRDIPEGDVHFSHDSLKRLGELGTGRREYTVVDCVTTYREKEEIEVGETSWEFTCPHE